ncbi:pentapeptide repeat-containing protein, partial [Streptomyces sp. NPDC026206]|uniref:pentapeptide repeat-containing protein n=1 Tax=Streptomyces sp. NPDC026206 TaxID=3157089 RepID=UPI0034017CBA
PWWIDGAHLRHRDLQPADGVVITGFRTMLVALGAGAVAGIGLYYTHRTHQHADKLYEHSQEQFTHAREKDREQAELTRESQVTDRYVQAIKLLGSPNITERLGGMYSLERIMRDSEKDHATVVEVLAAFVRQHARILRLEPDGSDPNPPRARPEEDVQAALTVLGRRPVRKEGFLIDLSHTDLRGVDLLEARMQGVSFAAAWLDGANLSAINLEGAYLESVRLDGAVLAEAHLDSADLSDAQCGKATFLDASLKSVQLRGVDLSETSTLTAEQLLPAILRSSTKLPERLAGHPALLDRISQVESPSRRAHPAFRARVQEETTA